MDRIVRLIFLICIRFLWRWRKKIPRRKRNTWGSVAEGENRKLIKQSIERKTASTSPRPRFSREDWKVKRKTGERRGVIREAFDEKEIFIKRKKKEVAMKNIDIKKKKRKESEKKARRFRSCRWDGNQDPDGVARPNFLAFSPGWRRSRLSVKEGERPPFYIL